jgi:methyl-accepting chemotaxis protein
MVAMMQKLEALELSEDLFEAMLVLGVLIGAAVLSVSWLFARSLSRPLLRTINNLSASSSEIAATITQQERIISQQATSVTETNTTMEELGASARQSAEQAANAAHNMQAVLGVAQEGVTKMETMTHAMDDLKAKVGAIAQQILHLSEQTSQIGSITEMVTVFANETKMLAMNAAVEAVRAGEHGKGFSVLSVEIRKLADESKRSADRIKSLVSDVQQATNTTVMVTEEGTKTVESSRILVKDTMETFNRVSNLINFAHENTQQISLNVRQQAEAVRQVLEAMNALSISAKETATGIGQTKIGIQTLNTAAQELKAMM